MSSLDDPAAALANLDATLPALDAAIAPLLARPWGETLAALGSLERAKMDVLLAYAINNLVWVYLKARGVEPDTHEVAKELERIRGYYAKVRDAESGVTMRRSRIDKDAAHRFVKAAIPAAQRSADTPGAKVAREQALAAVGPGRADRFRFVAKEGEKMIPGEGDDDEDEEDDEEEEEDDDDEDEEEEEVGRNASEEDEEEVDEGMDIDADADALLASVDSAIAAQGQDTKRSRRKRKRAGE